MRDRRSLGFRLDLDSERTWRTKLKTSYTGKWRSSSSEEEKIADTCRAGKSAESGLSTSRQAAMKSEGLS
ncbi:MAG: hypothetical protein KDB18_10170, partial [Salinibacterium sp.]|nr:hypothetical protein [Salinibacterium sp.]